METLFKDLRYGIRNLLKHPVFALVAISTLALAIGANSAMFTVVNAVLLRPLQYPDPDRLVWLEASNPPRGITQSNMSVPDLMDWQSQTRAFEHMAGFFIGGHFLNGDEPERVRSSLVTGDFFSVFRIPSLLGRTLQPDDVQPGRSLVVVISHGLWQRRFGADPAVIGRQVGIGSRSATLVGVMPQGFDYPAQSEMWLPLPLDPADSRDDRYLNGVARLKPGANIPQAQAELDTINQRLSQSYAATNTGWTVRVSNLQDQLVGNVRPSLLVLLGAVIFVLLIACANIANLLLARSTSRQKEIALRAALGASRFRIVRQLLTESMVLSVLGGALGLLLSLWLTKLLIAISPANSPRFDEIRPDARVFVFTIGLTIITSVVFGLAPALQASRLDQSEALKEGSRGNAGGARSNRIRSGLMVAEIAMSFMLLVGAGLLIKSFLHLREVTPGFTADNVLTVRVSGPPGKFREDAQREEFFRQVNDRLQTLPGVQSAGIILSLPLNGDIFNLYRGYVREGRPDIPEERGDAAYLPVSPSYFRTMQIPLISGRTFTDQDTANTAKVIIVNETTASRLWPGQSPVGRRVTISPSEKFQREIVGVVGETKASLDNEPGEQMYVPLAQDASWPSMSVVIRTSGDPASFSSAVRNEIRALDKAAPVFNVRTMNDLVATSVAPRRTPMLLLSAFAGAALLLAMMGIYGVTAYYVTQRTQEIGIRMALGAQMGDVLKLVLKGGMLLAVIGVGAGLVGAFVLTRWMTTMLFGVKPTDWMTFAAVSGCLLVTALLACYLPARRATKVDPLVALRYE
jgi:putative ABC transport system permease protein